MFQRESHNLIPLKLIKNPPKARGKECRPCTHPDLIILAAAPSLNHCYKIPHQILRGWDTVFQGTGPLCPPLPGKAIKLLFSTSPKALSLKFYSHQCTEGKLPSSLGHPQHLEVKKMMRKKKRILRRSSQRQGWKRIRETNSSWKPSEENLQGVGSNQPDQYIADRSKKDWELLLESG